MNTSEPVMNLLEPEAFPRFLDSDDIDKTKTRYVFFAGDLITPRRKQETREMEAIAISFGGRPFRITQNGGEDYQHRCLVRTKGIIPRAFITPIEMAANWVPPELVPPGADTFAPLGNDDFSVRGGVSVGTKSKYLVGEKYYPGQALTWMLSFARNNGGFSRGLVEVAHLMGEPYESGAAQEVQAVYFPNYPLLPTKLSEIQTAIQSTMLQQRGAMREIGQLMLHSCEEFRLWGTNFVAIEHGQVKIGTHTAGHVYEYSDTAVMLMEQLEITRQDQQFQAVAKMQEEQSRAQIAMMEALTQKGDANDDLKKMFLQSIENQNRIVELLAKTMPVQTPEPAKEDAKPAPKQKSDK